MNAAEIKHFIDHADVDDLLNFGRTLGVETWRNSYTSYKKAVYDLCVANEETANKMVAAVRCHP